MNERTISPTENIQCLAVWTLELALQQFVNFPLTVPGRLHTLDKKRNKKKQLQAVLCQDYHWHNLQCNSLSKESYGSKKTAVFWLGTAHAETLLWERLCLLEFYFIPSHIVSDWQEKHMFGPNINPTCLWKAEHLKNSVAQHCNIPTPKLEMWLKTFYVLFCLLLGFLINAPLEIPIGPIQHKEQQCQDFLT